MTKVLDLASSARLLAEIRNDRLPRSHHHPALKEKRKGRHTNPLIVDLRGILVEIPQKSKHAARAWIGTLVRLARVREVAHVVVDPRHDLVSRPDLFGGIEDEVYERQSYSRAPDGIGMIMVLRKRRSPIRRATTTRSSAPPTAELVVEFRRRAGRLTRVSVNPVGGGTTRYVQTLSTSPVISKLEALAALLDEEPARVVAVVRGASLHSHLSARPRHPGLAAVTMSLRSSHAWSRCGRWLIGTPKDREGSDVPDP